MLELATKKVGSTTVAFGGVVRLVRDKVDPEVSGLERYVAGEHMDSNNLRIRRWGEIGDGYLGPAFHMRFKPGQVLYGSRRTYLRKVAVADFEGITANTTYVLESANPEVLLPELLPFIMQTEAFAQHSIHESKGSVNPYVNFSDLAWFEFSLPPIDKQRQIASALGAARGMLDKLEGLATAADTLARAASFDAFSPFNRHRAQPSDWKRPTWKVAPLASLISSEAPVCYGIVQVGVHVPDGVPTLAINNLGGDLVAGVHRTAPDIEDGYRRSRVRPGDVLISIKGTIGEILAVPEHFAGNISRDLARLRFVSDQMSPQFFVHLYKSPAYQRYTNSLVVGTTRAELSIDTIRKMEVPHPSLSEQLTIASRLEEIDRAARFARLRVLAFKGLLAHMVEELLGQKETE